MDMFSALSEPTRRDILMMLANTGQMSASEIYDKFTATPPAISQHLKVLREAELVTVEKQAQKRLYMVNPLKVHELEDWVKNLTKVWEDRFTRLDKLLEEQQKHKTGFKK